MYKSGQYCFLNSPYLAPQEWHPFTITSTPNGDPYLSFHIRQAGDWTSGLSALLNPEKKLGLVCEDMMFAPNGTQVMLRLVVNLLCVVLFVCCFSGGVNAPPLCRLCVSMVALVLHQRKCLSTKQ